MANTTKSTKTTVPEEKENVTAQENEKLRAEMAEMKAQMEAFMKQMSQTAPQVVYQNSTKEEKDIEVISLTPGTLLITTTGRSDGVKYSFSNQFETCLVPESDLKMIARAMPETTRKGYFYINDEEFVKANGLKSSYRNMLNGTELAEILNKPVDEFMAKYNMVSNAQKTIIEGMVRQKKLNGERVDANILMELGKACGKDFMSIEPISAE